jgi:ribosomal protein L37AE/L43A
MKTYFCKTCKDEAQVDYDSLKGITTCVACGTELDKNIYVEEIGFTNQKANGYYIHNGLLRGKP